MIIDGKKIAGNVIEKLLRLPRPEKYLVAILVGAHKASESFVAQKQNTAKKLGVDFRVHRFNENLSQSALINEIKEFADDPTCGGIILQLPLPRKFEKESALNTIPPEKDVDVLGESAMNLFTLGKNLIAPPSVATVKEIFSVEKVNVSESTIAVVGLGFLVGNPIAEWAKRNAKETLSFDRETPLENLKNAEVVILGTGHAELVNSEMLSPKTLVIDFGYDATSGAAKGDFSPTGASELGIRYTPTPGGTGPILVAELFKNFYIVNGAKIV